MWKRQELEGISYFDDVGELKKVKEEEGATKDSTSTETNKVNIDLGVEDLKKDSQPLSLEELEEKYRKKNQTKGIEAKKAASYGSKNITKKKDEGDELEDSLEMD